MIVVHCFFYARCDHTVQSSDPTRAHELMEDHYREVHADDIATALTDPSRLYRSRTVPAYQRRLRRR